MAQSDFSFLDDLIPKEVIKEKIDSEVKDTDTFAEELEKETEGAEKTFSQMDMQTVLYSDVEKTKSYNVIIIESKVSGMEMRPFLYHRKLHQQILQIAKENNGRIMRADKAIEQYFKANDLTDCEVVLIHKNKSAMELHRKQLERKREQEELLKVPIAIRVNYNNGSFREAKLNSSTAQETIDELKTYLPSEAEPFSVREENKYIVFPTKYLFGSGNLEVLNAIGIIERHINSLRQQEKKKPISNSKYIVCNQDEAYAEEVWRIILKGEDAKYRKEK